MEFRKTFSHIQWRYVGEADSAWRNLVALSTLKGKDGFDGNDGANGENGITPKLRINSETNEWEVSYNDGVTWISMGVKATGEQGAQGEKGDKGETGAAGNSGVDSKETVQTTVVVTSVVSTVLVGNIVMVVVCIISLKKKRI